MCHAIMPFLFLLFWSLLFVLFAKSKYSVIASTLTSQIFNRHFKRWTDKRGRKKNQTIHQLSNECALRLPLYLPYRAFPFIHAVITPLFIS